CRGPIYLIGFGAPKLVGLSCSPHPQPKLGGTSPRTQYKPKEAPTSAASSEVGVFLCGYSRDLKYLKGVVVLESNPVDLSARIDLRLKHRREWGIVGRAQVFDEPHPFVGLGE